MTIRDRSAFIYPIMVGLGFIDTGLYNFVIKNGEKSRIVNTPNFSIFLELRNFWAMVNLPSSKANRVKRLNQTKYTSTTTSALIKSRTQALSPSNQFHFET